MTFCYNCCERVKELEKFNEVMKCELIMSNRHCREYCDKITELKDQVQNLQMSNAVKISVKKESDERYEARIDKLIQTVKNRDKTIVELKTTLEGMNTVLLTESHRVKKLEEELEKPIEKDSEIEELKEEIESLEDELNEVKFDLSKKSSEFEHLNSTHEYALKVIRERNDEISDLETMLKNSKQINTELSISIMNMGKAENDKIKDLEAKLNTLELALKWYTDTPTDKVVAGIEKVKILEDTLTAIRTERDNLRNSLATLTVSGAKARIEELEDQVITLKADKHNLNRKYNTTCAELGKTRAKLNQTRDELNKYRSWYTD